jgi:hypothetical protein
VELSVELWAVLPLFGQLSEVGSRKQLGRRLVRVISSVVAEVSSRWGVV